jgi:hypothetical protein
VWLVEARRLKDGKIQRASVTVQFPEVSAPVPVLPVELGRLAPCTSGNATERLVSFRLHNDEHYHHILFGKYLVNLDGEDTPGIA